jgi:hypothetical protein
MPWVVKAVGTDHPFWIDQNGGLSERSEDAAVYVSRPEAQDALERLKWMMPNGPLVFYIVDAESRP